MFSPLNSILLDRVTDRAQPLVDRQLFFDTMESLAPGLMNFPFDLDKKGPSEEIRSNLTRVDPEPGGRGRVYGHMPETPAPGETITDAHQAWLEEAQAALNSPAVQDLVGSKATKLGMAALSQSLSGGKRPKGHDPEALILSHAMMVDFALSG